MRDVLAAWAIRFERSVVRRGACQVLHISATTWVGGGGGGEEVGWWWKSRFSSTLFQYSCYIAVILSIRGWCSDRVVKTDVRNAMMRVPV